MTKLAKPHHEVHRTAHIGWMRASVLGANDGLISTSALLVGIAAANATPQAILLTGIAGLTAGALSMAAGEYVSVSSQADTEAADTAKERHELEHSPDAELLELTHIYVHRGLDKALARQVAEQLTAHDALGTHLRDELGISDALAARPVQAALASAAAFSVGALPPILLAWLWRGANLSWLITAVTLVLLAMLGALAGRLGGAPMLRGALRVLFWGAMAMGATALIGHWFGVAAA
ncbi:MAG: VIT1/CCC1 transporter family protein [Thermomonas sp.]